MDSTRSIAIISHADCALHNMGELHPERPERIRMIMEVLKQSNILPQLCFYEANLVQPEHLMRAHSKEYVNQILTLDYKHKEVYLDPDTLFMQHTLRAALLAAGSVIQAVDLSILGKHQQSFCNVRPPGHHALHDRAMGFCVFNNIAVGVAHALNVHKLNKVAIIDFDVHHGNGTQDIFQNELRVMLFSSYQYPFYPGNEIIIDDPHILHLPLSAGSNGYGWREKIVKQWLPILHNFQPEIIFISAGFDADRNDPIGGLKFVCEDYYWITQELAQIAKLYSNGRIISVLEGGYGQDLGYCALAHIQALVELAESSG